MKDITREERLEYAVLSHLVQFARQAKFLVVVAQEKLWADMRVSA